MESKQRSSKLCLGAKLKTSVLESFCESQFSFIYAWDVPFWFFSEFSFLFLKIGLFLTSAKSSESLDEILLSSSSTTFFVLVLFSMGFDFSVANTLEFGRFFFFCSSGELNLIVVSDRALICLFSPFVRKKNAIVMRMQRIPSTTDTTIRTRANVSVGSMTESFLTATGTSNRFRDISIRAVFRFAINTGSDDFL